MSRQCGRRTIASKESSVCAAPHMQHESGSITSWRARVLLTPRDCKLLDLSGCSKQLTTCDAFFWVRQRTDAGVANLYLLRSSIVTGTLDSRQIQEPLM